MIIDSTQHSEGVNWKIRQQLVEAFDSGIPPCEIVILVSEVPSSSLKRHYRDLINGVKPGDWDIELIFEKKQKSHCSCDPFRCHQYI